MFKHSLKRKAKAFLEEAEQILKQYLDPTDENVQKDVLDFCNALEQRYEETYKETLTGVYEAISRSSESHPDKRD
jgi:hypothetical protein